MSARTYSTEIDSDIGLLEAKITYEFDGGEPGDYHTPPTLPSVNIIEIKIFPVNLDPVVLEHIEDEILESEFS